MIATDTPTPEAKTDPQREADNELVISFLTLRNFIGISGMLLPVILILFTPKGQQDKVMEYSISDYYYTRSGDILVVLLSVIGVFLITYKGYSKLWERILTIVAAVCGIGVAFFPTATTLGNSLSIHVIRQKVPKVFNLIPWHFVFAGVFFIALAIISLHYFPKTHNKAFLRTSDGKRTRKAKRNAVYKICGWTMVVCVALMILYLLIQPPSLEEIPAIFILETVAVEAFGISWITKGQTLWPDGEHYLKRGLRRAESKLTRRTPNAG